MLRSGEHAGRARRVNAGGECGGPEVSEGPADNVEFFGVKLKVHNPRLAALLNRDVTNDLVVIGQKTRDLMVAAEDEAESGAGWDDRPNRMRPAGGAGTRAVG